MSIPIRSCTFFFNFPWYSVIIYILEYTLKSSIRIQVYEEM